MSVPQQTPSRRPVSATAVAIAILFLLLTIVIAVLRGPRVAAGLLGVAAAAVALRLLVGSRTRAAGGAAAPGVTRPAILLAAGLLVLGGSLAWPELSGRLAGRATGARAAAADVTSVTATSVTATPTLPTEVATTTAPPTTSAGLSASVQPDRLTASATGAPGVDAGNQPVSYDAANLTDGDLTTAWRVAGNGIGTALKAEWGTPVTLTAIALVPGYAKVDPVDHTDRFHQERRVLAVRCSFDSGAPLTLTFADSPTLQAIAVDVTTRTVTIEITQTTSAPERDFTAISELAFQGHRA